MSYILDALRKADADRERGHVPSIHAQTVMPGTAPVSVARGPRIGLWIALGVLVLVLAVGLTWWLAGGSSQRDAAANSAAVRPTSMPVAAAPAPAAMPAPTTTASAAPPTATTAAASSTAPAHTATAKPKPKPAAPAIAKTQPATQGPTPMTASAAPASETSAPPSQSPNATGPHAGKIYAITELPDNIRSQLPQIAVGGSMYSPVAANRILIVNGQVLHEGDRITPEVTLEQVRVKAAVLAFKGYRYLVSY